MSDTWKNILMRYTSRKFLLAVLGIVVVFSPRWGFSLSAEEIGAITNLIIVFTVAEGVADVGRVAITAYGNYKLARMAGRPSMEAPEEA